MKELGRRKGERSKKDYERKRMWEEGCEGSEAGLEGRL